MVEFAPESPQVDRARHKLMKEFAEADKKLSSPQDRQEEAQKIKHWLQRHESERINLKDKEVTLFDQNQHSEQPHNRYVKKLALAIKGIPSKSEPSESLQGRITHPDNK